MIKFGIMVNNIGASQMSYYIVRNINRIYDTRDDLDVIVYYQVIHKQTLPHRFATMQVTECWNQHTPIIATSLSTAHKLLEFPGPTQKLYYIWDIEWLRPDNSNYELHRHAIVNPELTLIARSREHADIIENCFNRKIEHIVDDFNIEQILEVLEHVE